MILVIVDALRTVSKGLENKRQGKLDIRGRIETIQTIELLKSARLFRRVRRFACHSDFSETPPVKTGVKTSKKKKDNNY